MNINNIKIGETYIYNPPYGKPSKKVTCVHIERGGLITSTQIISVYFVATGTNERSEEFNKIEVERYINELPSIDKIDLKDENLFCDYCKKIKTGFINRHAKRECASCGNKNYYDDLDSGEAIRIRFYKNEYKPGTYEQITALLAMNKK